MRAASDSLETAPISHHINPSQSGARILGCDCISAPALRSWEMGILDFSLSSEPVLVSYIRTSLRLIHFLGLVLGLGGAVFLDLILSRYRRMIVSAELVGHIEWISRFVALGLLLLWISGLGFLALYQLAEPEKLMNPKIWAKLTIVSILTANGLVIHRFVLPFVRRQIGSTLLAGITSGTKGALIGCVVISLVSWSVPVILGASPQLNFVVPCAVILAAYALLLVQAFLIATLMMRNRFDAAVHGAT